MTVDEYLEGVPEPARTTLSKLRAMIRAAVPQETEETVTYRMPAYKYRGMLVGFAAFANHCAFTVMSGTTFDGFRKELEGYDTSKGSIRFPVDKPLPKTLVTKLVKARVAENEARKKGRG
ncbi:MAG: DUF1801 domain-containing protein [Bryobacteraceae bacterium]|nr:DUF1801 domain-containing protein [Bryobacteraceae bacterium]